MSATKNRRSEQKGASLDYGQMISSCIEGKLVTRGYTPTAFECTRKFFNLSYSLNESLSKFSGASEAERIANRVAFLHLMQSMVVCSLSCFLHEMLSKVNQTVYS